ncbi:hypothetical protein V6N13_099397 [Hibiscus sabdariffa]|uniref:Uncharacterized protein n=1 Tax=Hibiscus sabdariffa TaxID=183260 RepID=A0ABR2PZJ5_9ROSI
MQHRGYQFLTPQGKVVISKHVVFNETSFPQGKVVTVAGQPRATLPAVQSTPEHQAAVLSPAAGESLLQMACVESGEVPTTSEHMGCVDSGHADSQQCSPSSANLCPQTSSAEHDAVGTDVCTEVLESIGNVEGNDAQKLWLWKLKWVSLLGY